MLPFHTLANIFPLVEGREFAELVEDVRANGLREKITIHDGAILDGRNRYRAALAAGLLGEDEGEGSLDRIRFFAKFLPQYDGDPLQFVLSKNLHRRHLSESQRAMVAARIANLKGGRPAETAPIGAVSQDEAADRLNVSRRSVQRAAVVQDRGVAEVQHAVDEGRLPVSRAEQIARMPEPEQREEVARINGHRAIMASRQEPDDSLDYFPTPPWATRAFVKQVVPRLGLHGSLRAQSVWEPACGEGHMAEVLTEYFGEVFASDVHGYGYGNVFDFVAGDYAGPARHDWIITNPPFGDLAESFVLRALERARVGVAMFLRLQWLETVGRYERIFAAHPPAVIAQFAERVPLHRGRWEPEGSTATAYVWIVWLKDAWKATTFLWVPPGQREALARSDDVARFTAHPVRRRLPPHDPETGEIIEPGDGDTHALASAPAEPAPATSKAGAGSIIMEAPASCA